jgi:tetratricopeptide (TPR) repeat protein
MHVVLLCFMSLLLLGLGSATYIRNLAWSSERTLWEDALQKAPGRARPAYNLAKHHYKRIGQLDKALALYERALQGESARPEYTRATALNGMASVYHIKKEHEKVIELLSSALTILPEFAAARYNLALAFANTGAWHQASQTVDHLLKKQPTDSFYQYLKAIFLNRQQKPLEALKYLQPALRTAPDDKRISIAIAESLGQLGRFGQAQFFYRQAHRQAPEDMPIFFCLIENSVKAGDATQVNRYLEQLLSAFKLSEISEQLESEPKNIFAVSYTSAVLIPLVACKLERYSDELKHFQSLAKIESNDIDSGCGSMFSNSNY